MPRGKKKTALESFNEQIEKIDAQILTHQDKLNELQAQKKNLLEQKKKSEVELIYQKIQKSGKSIDEVLKIFEQE
jgi:septal ring factor EnvC (AmiA/AmiB activator)